ncbi:MAG: hypothetical protein JWN43_2253 [Gammaproteobacteria bacterium]|nr:hypothetical protein [Gammaproteobacteria bacterium]
MCARVEGFGFSGLQGDLAMGFRVSSLDKLPVVPDTSLYIFLLRRYQWESKLGNALDENFDNLARNIARDAAAVAPLQGGWDGDLRAVLGKNVERAYSNKVFSLEVLASNEGAMVILGRTPNTLSARISCWSFRSLPLNAITETSLYS